MVKRFALHLQQYLKGFWCSSDNSAMSLREEIMYYVCKTSVQIDCVCWHRLTKVGACAGYAHKYLLLKREKMIDQASAPSAVHSASGQSISYKIGGLVFGYYFIGLDKEENTEIKLWECRGEWGLSF